jgi:hypothetical protein
LKVLRQNKVIGLAIGERSLLAAELTAGDKPSARQLAEFVYPDGLSTANPDALGKALGEFLGANGFTAKSAVVGLPARWLVVKPKEVPPTDPATLAEMLRLQAEGEFSSELKDLVYDYAAASGDEAVKSVLLIATQKKHVDSASALCEAAGLNAIAVMPTAIALGAATGQTMGRDAMVLAVSSSGAELTAHASGAASAIRHLRAPVAERPFIGELRRAVSSMPTNGSALDLIMWDSTDSDPRPDADALGKSLGFAVRSGDLSALGVDAATAGRNGQGPKYAAAVALGLVGIGIIDSSVDFLHSRLAPPEPRRIPRWAIYAGIAAVLLISLGILAYNNLQQNQAVLDAQNNKLAGLKDQINLATQFVNNVSFAQGWYDDNPRYISCVRDITNAMPNDSQTYATSLVLRENPHPQATATKAATDPNLLLGTLAGKTANQQGVLVIQEHLKHTPGFSDVEVPGTTGGLGTGPGKIAEVSWSITFEYIAPKATK